MIPFHGEKIISFQYLLSFIVVFEPPRREMWGSLCTIVLSIISLINGLCVYARARARARMCMQFLYKSLLEYLFLVSNKLVNIAIGKSMWKFCFPRFGSFSLISRYLRFY